MAWRSNGVAASLGGRMVLASDRTQRGQVLEWVRQGSSSRAAHDTARMEFSDMHGGREECSEMHSNDPRPEAVAIGRPPEGALHVR